MSELKEKVINAVVLVAILFVVIGSAWIAHRTVLLENCVDAANASGKFYIDTKECDYLTKENNND